MFVPGFPTPEGAVRWPDHCPFPEQVSVRDEVALLLRSQGSVPFGLCSDWGS